MKNYWAKYWANLSKDKGAKPQGLRSGDVPDDASRLLSVWRGELPCAGNVQNHRCVLFKSTLDFARIIKAARNRAAFFLLF